MELSDLKLGDVVELDILPSSFSYRESWIAHKGTATIIGIDAADKNRDICVGWKDSTMFAGGPAGYPYGTHFSYLPTVHDRQLWPHALWIGSQDVVRVIPHSADQANPVQSLAADVEPVLPPALTPVPPTQTSQPVYDAAFYAKYYGTEQ